MKTLILLSLSSFLLACTTRPPCNIPSKLVGNAGCLIMHGDQFLVARHRKKDKWNLPGGTAERGESAQCTAVRETGEELGIQVEVGPLLRQQDNGFYLFSCTLKPGEYQSSYTVPLSGVTEVSRISWLKLDDVVADDWRYSQRWQTMAVLIRAQVAKPARN